VLKSRPTIINGAVSYTSWICKKFHFPDKIRKFRTEKTMDAHKFSLMVTSRLNLEYNFLTKQIF